MDFNVAFLMLQFSSGKTGLTCTLILFGKIWIDPSSERGTRIKIAKKSNSVR